MKMSESIENLRARMISDFRIFNESIQNSKMREICWDQYIVSREIYLWAYSAVNATPYVPMYSKLEVPFNKRKREIIN